MKSILKLLFCLLALGGFTGFAQAQEVPIMAGTTIVLRISGVPAEEAAAVSGPLTVGGDGKIRLTYLNTSLQAAGLTHSQLGLRIEAAYKAAEIFTSPTVQISQEQGPNGGTSVISVGGEVRSPRDVPYRPEMTIFSAINSAGGPSEYARMQKVKLIRNGQERILDLRKVTPETNIKVQSGDEIYVPGG